MKTENNIKLNNMFGCTVAEAREGLKQRNNQLIIKMMVDEDEREAEILAEALDYTYGDNVDREQ